MDKKRDFIIALITFAIIAGLIVSLCVTLIPILADIFTNQDGRNAIEIIHSHGIRGIPLLACLQALQVITTVVPAVFIQVPAGLVYGTWAGLTICLMGSIIGNVIVFVALRQFSMTIDHIFPTRKRKREEKARKPKKKSRLPFFLNPESLNRMPHPELVAFYVYLIPGIPNGVLPHIFAHTKVSFGRYLVAVIAGNAPSTLVCTLVGDRLAHGDWRSAVVIVAVFVGCIGIALLLRRKLITFISGGYSLNLGFSNRPQGEVPGSAADGSAFEGLSKKNVAVTDCAGIEAASEKREEEEAGESGSEAATNAANDALEPSQEEYDASQAAAAEHDAAQDGTAQAAAAEGMKAVGADGILPRGWRVLKGKKQ